MPSKKIRPTMPSPPDAIPTLKSYEVPKVGPEVDLNDLIDGYLEDLDTCDDPVEISDNVYKDGCRSGIRSVNEEYSKDIKNDELNKSTNLEISKIRESDSNDDMQMDDKKMIFEEMNKKIIELVRDRFEESMVRIENRMSKGVGNGSPDIIDQWLRYLLIDWPLAVIFDSGGDI
ncbi:10663_t:CDS:2, partial [Racocetra persica]